MRVTVLRVYYRYNPQDSMNNGAILQKDSLCGKNPFKGAYVSTDICNISGGHQCVMRPKVLSSGESGHLLLIFSSTPGVPHAEFQGQREHWDNYQAINSILFEEIPEFLPEKKPSFYRKMNEPGVTWKKSVLSRDERGNFTKVMTIPEPQIMQRCQVRDI